MSDKSIGESAHVNIHDALKLDGSAENIIDYYKNWAATYDKDVVDNYYGIQLIADLLHNSLQQAGYKHSSVPIANTGIVDVGCGTGLLAAPLQKHGYEQLDGIDLSSEMIEKARETGLYRQLFAGINIHHTIPADLKNSYHAAVCLGVFTPGHVQPESLYGIAELVMPGGVMVISTRIPYYAQTNYQEVSDQIERDGIAILKQCHRDAPYRDDGDAHYWIYEVQ
jgi:2-polyprenyl-3-methyl-5-hydroxy-6-metoxy-1,4-benzoquinol methylase